MLARIRREETLRLRLSKKKYDGKWPLLGVVERIEFARNFENPKRTNHSCIGL